MRIASSTSLVQFAPLDVAPPANDDSYLGLTWAELVETSRQRHPDDQG